MFTSLFQGDRIHATVKRTLVYKFQNQLQEGCVYSIQGVSVGANVGSFRTCHHNYKLFFQFSTKVQQLETGHVIGDGYDFIPIPQIRGNGFNADFLVGQLCSYIDLYIFITIFLNFYIFFHIFAKLLM